jgi:large subunit ribosomal protein L5e
VKFRRRRECKTDYYSRIRLITQDKNKYKTPKYRFVVRKSHRDVTCQIFSADLTHDVCVASAYSHELARYGVNIGLTNYAAAYCTGLLLARRVNAKFNLPYEGNTEINGEDYNVEADGEKAPFKALLDVGLQRTTTGARVFGALKGACDGGLYVPHGDKRFPGTTTEGKEVKPNPDVHRKYIFAGHVAEYMAKLEEADPEAYQKQFSRFIREGVKGEDLEKMYTDAHAAIRADPLKKRGPKERGSFHTREKAKDPKAKFPKKTFGAQAISIQQRKARIRTRLVAAGLKEIVETYK